MNFVSVVNAVLAASAALVEWPLFPLSFADRHYAHYVGIFIGKLISNAKIQEEKKPINVLSLNNPKGSYPVEGDRDRGRESRKGKKWQNNAKQTKKKSNEMIDLSKFT